MIIIIPTIKYGSTYYNSFTMGVCSNYHGFFSVSFNNMNKIHISFIKKNYCFLFLTNNAVSELPCFLLVKWTDLKIINDNNYKNGFKLFLLVQHSFYLFFFRINY